MERRVAGDSRPPLVQAQLQQVALAVGVRHADAGVVLADDRRRGRTHAAVERLLVDGLELTRRQVGHFPAHTNKQSYGWHSRETYMPSPEFQSNERLLRSFQIRR